MVFSIVSVIFNIYNNFVIVDTMGKMFDALDDILYSIHFIFLLFLDVSLNYYHKRNQGYNMRDQSGKECFSIL